MNSDAFSNGSGEGESRNQMGFASKNTRENNRGTLTRVIHRCEANSSNGSGTSRSYRVNFRRISLTDPPGSLWVVLVEEGLLSRNRPRQHHRLSSYEDSKNLIIAQVPYHKTHTNEKNGYCSFHPSTIRNGWLDREAGTKAASDVSFFVRFAQNTTGLQKYEKELRFTLA